MEDQQIVKQNATTNRLKVNAKNRRTKLIPKVKYHVKIIKGLRSQDTPKIFHLPICDENHIGKQLSELAANAR